MISPLEESADAIWCRGGFPRVHWSRPRARPEDWLPNCLALCLERDIPQLGFRISSLRLRALLTLLAHGQGGLCNLSELGAGLGISYHNVAHILDIVEGVFLVRRLPPFFANIRKRLVKAPKLCLRDTGLLHSLLGMGFTKPKILAHPKAGASFETYCVEQIISHAKLADPSAQAFFFRTHTGTEVDLLLESRGRMVAIEIQLGLQVPDIRSLESCMADLGLKQGYVVNAGQDLTQIRPGIAMGGLLNVLEDLGFVPKGWSPETSGARP